MTNNAINNSSDEENNNNIKYHKCIQVSYSKVM